MKVLLTNDDGIQALGLWSLAVKFAKNHEVVIVAPLKQQSGMSQALSVLRHVEFMKLAENQINKFMNDHYPDVNLNNPIEAWTIDGTPTDCVKIYLEAICKTNLPDLILSGINHGANLATDVLYSGTVGAAIEGFLHEIPSAAVSLDIESQIYFKDVADVIYNYFESKLSNESNEPFIYNINFPKRYKDDQPQFKFAKLGRRDYINAFQLITDDEGRTFYRVGGQIYDIDRSEGTDIFVADSGFISVTPLQVDLTDYNSMR